MKKATLTFKKRMADSVAEKLEDRETTIDVKGLWALDTKPLNRMDPRVLLNAAAGNIVLREKGKGFAPPTTDTTFIPPRGTK